MRRVHTAIVASLVCAATVPAAAWDYPGHRVVGAIADQVLAQHDTKTRAAVSSLLDLRDASGIVDRRSLSEVAVFPDCAKDEEEYCRRKPSQEEIHYVFRNLVHKSFHFTNSPLKEPAYMAGGVGTFESDIVQMIAHIVVQLRKEQPPFKRDVKLTSTEAVWLLAHLVGDIHQPLHVGQIYFDATCNTEINPNEDKNKPAASTFGGNLIKFKPTWPEVPPAPNLHLYWDGAAVAKAMRDAGFAGSEEGFAKMLAAKPPADWQIAGPPETWPQKWVAEIMPLAIEAHAPQRVKITGRPGDKPAFPSSNVVCEWEGTLMDGYEKWASERASEQLQKAGFRLAAMLREIFHPGQP